MNYKQKKTPEMWTMCTSVCTNAHDRETINSFQPSIFPVQLSGEKVDTTNEMLGSHQQNNEKTEILTPRMPTCAPSILQLRSIQNVHFRLSAAKALKVSMLCYFGMWIISANG